MQYIYWFCCKLAIGNAETEAWFIDSFEEWRKAKNLSNFILLGHSFGGYVAAKYALKVIISSLSIWIPGLV
jgi:abhydrolase domain-containing protein 5